MKKTLKTLLSETEPKKPFPPLAPQRHDTSPLIQLNWLCLKADFTFCLRRVSSTVTQTDSWIRKCQAHSVRRTTKMFHHQNPPGSDELGGVASLMVLSQASGSISFLRKNSTSGIVTLLVTINLWHSTLTPPPPPTWIPERLSTNPREETFTLRMKPWDCVGK